MRPRLASGTVLVALSLLAADTLVLSATFNRDEAYLRWPMKQVETVGKAAYVRGRVGGLFDTRGLGTDRAYNYKLAATWLTPDVIRATARLLQLRSRLSDDETRALVAEAEAVEGTVVIVEIDPREGSGVIPRDWEALLQPKGRPGSAVRGAVRPELRDIRALAGVLRRNYDYDRFWVTFPLKQQDGSPLFLGGDARAELIVRVLDKEGRVEWRIPPNVVSMLRLGVTGAR